MDMQQARQEIKDLHDQLDRVEVSMDQNIAELQIIVERHIPAATASIRHTLSGTQQILADLAGTVHILACTTTDLSQRITLLERCIDPEIPRNSSKT